VVQEQDARAVGAHDESAAGEMPIRDPAIEGIPVPRDEFEDPAHVALFGGIRADVGPQAGGERLHIGSHEPT
jgi:hypothetical protein